MKLIKSKHVSDTSEFSVEFECYCKFLVNFEENSDLAKAQVLTKAKEIAAQAFGEDGMLVTERICRKYAYTLTALGIDAGSAIILSPATSDKAHLKVIK